MKETIIVYKECTYSSSNLEYSPVDSVGQHVSSEDNRFPALTHCTCHLWMLSPLQFCHILKNEGLCVVLVV